MNKYHYAVLLAGGNGSRLADLTTPDFPKQFFRLPGKPYSLLQQTAIDAAAVFGVGNVITVTRSEYLPRVKAELQALSPELAENVVGETHPNGTAGAAVLAAQKAGVGKVLWFLPCDHVRSRNLADSFIRPASKAAEKDKIVVFGLPPCEADPRFGYFLTREDGSVRQFVEKPPQVMAESFIATGKAYWHSGIAAMKTEVLMRTLKQFAPQVLTGRLEKPLALDNAVLERADNVVAFPFEDGGWMDIGSREAICRWWRSNAPHVQEWDFGSGKKVRLGALAD